MQIDIKEYSAKDLAALHIAFLASFADYFVSFQPDLAQFQQRIHYKIQVNPAFSRLAWADNQVIGFVLHTIGNYQGVKTLYNGGTGVIPTFQKQKIATRLYLDVLRMINHDADRIILEVVENNAKAIRLYESFDFHFLRMLKCFKLKKAHDFNDHFSITQSLHWKAEYDHHLSVLPGFIDDSSHLKSVIAHECILEAWEENQLIGHLIFQKQNARISQLAVHPNHRGKGAAKRLLAEAQKITQKVELTLMNIDESAQDTISALEKLGFQNELNQLELELTL